MSSESIHETGRPVIVFPVEVTVRPWTIDRGVPLFPTQHQYVEMLWLPVIGPSTTWLLRRLSGWALACPEGLTVVLPELTESLGLGWSSGSGSSVQRSRPTPLKVPRAASITGRSAGRGRRERRVWHPLDVLGVQAAGDGFFVGDPAVLHEVGQ